MLLKTSNGGEKAMEFKEDGIVANGEFFSLQTITRKCLTEKVKTFNLNLLVIEWESSRGFDGAKESIVMPLEEINKVISLINGKQCYFGEIAGKHSEIYGDVDDKDFKLYTEVDEVVAFLESNPTRREYNHSFLDTMRFFNDESGYSKDDESFDKDLDELDKLLKSLSF